MNTAEIKALIAEIIEIDVAEISDTVPLAELGFDSLSYINFIVEVEMKYNIEVLDSDLFIENFSTVENIRDTLEKYFEDDERIYKCIITDCDGVLWNGIAGESGNDIAYFDKDTVMLGEALKKLRQKGILLAVCSKNELPNIQNMLSDDNSPLKIEDFVIMKTDTINKAESVGEIIEEIGIFADSVVYLEDSDYEIGLVKNVIETIKTVKADYTKNFIDKLLLLFENTPEVSDMDRTAMYREQKEREKIHKTTMRPQEYNHVLYTVTDCGKAKIEDADRIAELSQRTNRFNVTGARYTAEEISAMIECENYTVYVLKAGDVFGYMGLVAAAVVHGTVIENFMVSCRVFGRDFEIALLDQIRIEIGDELSGIYVPTEKNGYCKDFYRENGITYEEREYNM